MNNRQKGLMNALDNAKRDRARMEKREMERIWRDIQVPISLYDALSRLTKDDLTDIRQKLDVKKASGLKKEELIQLLQQVIPTKFEKICLTIDAERYTIIENIALQSGSASADHLSLTLIEDLGRHGLVFTGSHHRERVAVIPSELVDAFQSFNHTNVKTTTERNTEWIRLTHGLLYYYGVLSTSTLIKQVKTYSAYDLGDSFAFLTVIHDAAHCYREMIAKWTGISHARVFDAEHVLNEQKKRADIPYYPFSKSELITAGTPGYVEQNQSTRQFAKFLTENYDVTFEEAKLHADECAHGIKLGQTPNTILQLLQHQFELKGMEDVKLFMEHLMNLSNNTRQWFLKGYTAKEVHELENTDNHTDNVIDFQTKKKVGRNDTCPCGSGKKYKKCCGK